MTPLETAEKILSTVAELVGVDRIVELVAKIANKPERSAAMLAALYSANDAAIDEYERRKLQDAIPTPKFYPCARIEVHTCGVKS
jgi:hypothetical protein